MDVSRFTTTTGGETRVLYNNSMQYPGYTPLVFKTYGDTDTLNPALFNYIVRSVCCIPIGATCYAVAAVCGACGCVVAILSGLGNPCCDASDHFEYNTTQWVEQSCLYETFCSKRKAAAATPVASV